MKLLRDIIDGLSGGALEVLALAAWIILPLFLIACLMGMCR